MPRRLLIAVLRATVWSVLAGALLTLALWLTTSRRAEAGLSDRDVARAVLRAGLRAPAWSWNWAWRISSWISAPRRRPEGPDEEALTLWLPHRRSARYPTVMSRGRERMIAGTAVVSLLAAAATLSPDAPQAAESAAQGGGAVAGCRGDPAPARGRGGAAPLPGDGARSPSPSPPTSRRSARTASRDSRSRFPAVVGTVGDDGQPRSIPITLRTRGHARLIQNCGFVPLRLEFPGRPRRGRRSRARAR